MRNTGWKIIATIILMLMVRATAFSEGISGWVNLVGNSSESFEDGKKISATEMYNKNLYLKLDKSITPMLFYQMNLRTNLSDTDVTDSDGITEKTSMRRLEPALDLTLRNLMYDVSVGLRRQEEWSSESLTDETRETSEFYYTRFNLSPVSLPSLSPNIDRQKDYDYPPSRETDLTKDSYSIGSSYDLPSSDMKFTYNLNFAHSEDKTPLSTTYKTINDNFNGNYALGYNGHFWGEKARYALGYQGNYSRNENQQFLTQTGSFANMRTTIETLKSTDSTPETDPLLITSQSQLLHNGEYLNDATGIKLNSLYQNIGILIIMKEVDTLYIYYKNNGQANQVTWRVYWSSNNVGWNFINETTVSPALDTAKDAYRYKISLPATSAIYFKAVNMNTVPQVGGSDVEITEIEAWGTDEVLDTHTVATSSSFNQGLNITASVKPQARLSFAFNYSLDRADQNPVSIGSSMWGIVSNILTDSVSGNEDDFRSNIGRNYGLTALWLTHPLLTTTMRYQRNENFDNTGDTDSDSNTYNISFNYIPLPTLDTTLSLIRSDRYDFNEKDSTNNSVMLSIGSRLYRDVNMITDMGYTRSESYTTGSNVSSYSISGTLDALITRKLSGTMNYSYNETLSDDTTSTSKEAMTTLNYQPGKLINFSGNFSIADSQGDITTSEGLLMDWLPLPALRFNVGYRHTDSEPGPVISDTISGYGIWYLTKFADVRFSYSYTKQVEYIKTENYNFNTNLNCRF